MLRPSVVKTLFEAVALYEVKSLNLEGNFLGDAFAEALAKELGRCELTDLDLLHNNFSKAAMRSLRNAAPRALKLHLEYGQDEDGKDGMADSERTVSRAARASMGERVQIARRGLPPRAQDGSAIARAEDNSERS